MKKLVKAVAFLVLAALPVAATTSGPLAYYNETTDRGCTYPTFLGFFWEVYGIEGGSQAMGWGDFEGPEWPMEECIEWAGPIS